MMREMMMMKKMLKITRERINFLYFAIPGEGIISKVVILEELGK
ncbi:MAG: hypothetical protein AB1414_10315 [bacterium]